MSEYESYKNLSVEDLYTFISTLMRELDDLQTAYTKKSQRIVTLINILKEKGGVDEEKSATEC